MVPRHRGADIPHLHHHSLCHAVFVAMATPTGHDDGLQCKIPLVAFAADPPGSVLLGGLAVGRCLSAGQVPWMALRARAMVLCLPVHHETVITVCRQHLELVMYSDHCIL